MQSSPLPCYLVPLRPKYSPQHPVLEHPKLSSPLNVSDQVSHPHKTGKMIVMCNLIFIFLYSKLEDESATNESHQTTQYKLRQQPQPTTAYEQQRLQGTNQ